MQESQHVICRLLIGSNTFNSLQGMQAQAQLTYTNFTLYLSLGDPIAKSFKTQCILFQSGNVKLHSCELQYPPKEVNQQLYFRNKTEC